MKRYQLDAQEQHIIDQFRLITAAHQGSVSNLLDQLVKLDLARARKASARSAIVVKEARS
jgi:hypothetical protein